MANTKHADEVSKQEPERHNHTVKLPFINKGKELKEGDKVSLRVDQAERLKKSGHI